MSTIKPSAPKECHPKRWNMIPPKNGDTERIRDVVAIAMPRMAPVSLDGTALVITAMETIFRIPPPNTIGIRTMQNSYTDVTID